MSTLPKLDLSRLTLNSPKLKIIVKILVYIPGNTKRISTAKTPSKNAKKAIGMVRLFSVFFSEVLSIRQSHELESSSAALSSFYSSSLCTSFTRSNGLFPLLSLKFLLAPLIKRARRGLPDLSYSELFTARWRGVYPSMSCILSVLCLSHPRR